MVLKVADGVAALVGIAGRAAASDRFGRGPYPGGDPGPYQGGYGWNSTRPPEYRRGPWGYCRNTPYHGPLPGGGWK